MKEKKNKSLGELLKETAKNAMNTITNTIVGAYNEQLASKYKDTNDKLTKKAKKESKGKKANRYNLRNEILNNQWLKEGRPASRALKWLYKEVFSNPKKYKYNTKFLFQGGLFTFKYLDPKYKDSEILPFFDKYPLVLSLGPIPTKEGIRNLGFNLHLLPPKVRLVTLCFVFSLYRRTYRYTLTSEKLQRSPINIQYKAILKFLEPYGVTFSVRMYIPQRMDEIVTFPLSDWYKAIFIPSRGYYDIKAKELIKEWKKFCTKRGYSSKDNLDWKSITKRAL